MCAAQDAHVMPEIFSSIVDIVAAELDVAAVLAEAPALAVDAALAEAPVLTGDGDDGLGVGIVGHAPLCALFSYRLRVAFAVSSAQFYVQCYARSAV